MAASRSSYRRQHCRRFPAHQPLLQLLAFGGGPVMVWRCIARTLRDGPATSAPAAISDDTVLALAARMHAAAQQRLGRSLAIRAIDAGSCNGCELELNALAN